jgi:hypothetical protein
MLTIIPKKTLASLSNIYKLIGIEQKIAKKKFLNASIIT